MTSGNINCSQLLSFPLKKNIHAQMTPLVFSLNIKMLKHKIPHFKYCKLEILTFQ